MPAVEQGRGLRWAVAAVAWLAVFAGSAFATDYSHDCRSSDGQWQMWDEGLSATDDANHTDIPYETVKDTLLSQKKGYCLSQGSKFEFEAKTYIRRARFDYQGQRYEVDLLCEMAADGLPAAYNCEKEVVTLDTTASRQGQATSATWSHNGSIMRLEANGVTRVFSYEKPRPGMVKAGAKAGDVVFKGTREGNSYSGTAYVFSKACGRTGYAVDGPRRGRRPWRRSGRRRAATG